jgi:hypothetical protein
VLGARAAAQRELSAECAAGAVQTHAHRIRGGAEPAGGLAYACAIEVYPPQHVGVGRRKRVDKVQNALANGLFHFRIVIRLLVAGCDGVMLQRPALGRGVPEVIGDGVAEQAVEPGDHGLVVPDGRGFFDTLRERSLQNVLGRLPVANAPLDEPEETAVVFDQRR